MSRDLEKRVAVLKRETITIVEDSYLSEMTDRLQKLRSLVGEQQERKGRAKRWQGRLN